MKIGHSNQHSQTFLPEFKKVVDQDFIYADIPGQLDAGGALVEFINIFTTKKIFQRAKFVRFIVAMTREQMVESKGNECKNFLQTLQYMCQTNLATMIDSIQPVVTKVKRGSDDVDIEEIRYNMHDLLQVVREHEQGDQEFLDSLDQFYDGFSQKLEIFDPLDRDILNEEEVNQAIKRDQLVKKI